MNKKWTLDKCAELAKECKTQKEFQMKHPKAYHTSIKNKWMDKFNFIRLRETNGYWTKERCIELVNKCTTKKEFREKYRKAYDIILREGWLDIIKDLQVSGNRYMRLIYVYEFSDNHAYVGLTSDVKRRDKSHKKGRSAVYDHMVKTNIEPTLKIITPQHVQFDEAQKLEGKIINDYKQNGWFILNRKKSGDLGGSYSIWSKEACEKAAKSCTSIGEFKKKYSRAYNLALLHKWSEEMCSHMTRKRKW